MRTWKMLILSVLVVGGLAACDDGDSSGNDDTGNDAGMGEGGGSGGGAGGGASGGDTGAAAGGGQGGGAGGGEGGGQGGGAGGGEGGGQGGGVGGGEGGGAGGGAGGGDAACGDFPATDFNAVAQQDVDIWRAAGNNAGDSILAGSCGGGNGPETIFVFTAPEAGAWTFSTANEGTAIDTVLYVLNTCPPADPGAPTEEEELACNDDSAGLQSAVEVELAADEMIYVVADSFGAEGGDFELTAFIAGVLAPGDECEAGAAVTCPEETACLDADGDGTSNCVSPLLEPGAECTPESGFICPAGTECLDGDEDGTSNCEDIPAECPDDWAIVGALDAADNWTVSGDTTEAADVTAGSCGGAGTAPDHIYTFTAEGAGTYTFFTAPVEEGQFDTALYLRRICRSTDLEICNDDGGEGTLSQATAELDAGETLYVIVTGFGENAGNYTLTAAQPTAPAVTAVSGRVAAASGVWNVSIEGTDAENDPATATVEFLDEAGEVVASREDAPLNIESAEDGAFAASVTGQEAEGALDAAVNVRVTVTDRTGLSSEAMMGAISAAMAPAITNLTIRVNPTTRGVGFEATGTDADTDVDAFRFEVLDGEGEAILAPDGLFDFTELTQEGGNWTGTWSATLPEQINIAEEGEPADLIDPLAGLATVRITVVDLTGLESEPAAGAPGDPVAAERGATCDFAGVLGLCPNGDACNDADLEDEAGPVCEAVVAGCPDDYVSGELVAGDGVWTGMGDTTGQTPATAGSCGGGGGAIVFPFTAPAAGTYSITTASEAEGADTVVYVRSACRYADPRLELACNDDPAPEMFLASTDVELGAEQMVYIFVDGFAGGFGAWQGPFTVTVTAE